MKEDSELQGTLDKRLLIYVAIFSNGETRDQVVGREAIGLRAPPPPHPQPELLLPLNLSPTDVWQDSIIVNCIKTQLKSPVTATQNTEF